MVAYMLLGGANSVAPLVREADAEAVRIRRR
jgi:hypothetical protein